MPEDNSSSFSSTPVNTSVGNDVGNDVGGTGAVGRKAQARKEVAKRLSEETGETIRQTDVRIKDGTARLNPVAQGKVDKARKEQAAKELQGQLETEIGASDIVLTKEGPQLSKEAQKREAKTRFSKDAPPEFTVEDVELTQEGAKLSDQARKEAAVENLQDETTIQVQAEDIALSDGTARLKDSVQQQEALATLQQETDIELTREDLITGQDGFQLSEQARKREAVTDLQGETQTEIGADDVRLTEDGAELTEDAQLREGVNILEAETDIDLQPGDVELTDDGVALSEKAQREEARAELSDDLGIDLGSDDIQTNPDGQGFVPTESARKRAAAQKLNQDTEIDVAPSDVQLADGQASLKPQARRREAAQTFQPDTQIDLQPEDIVLTEGTAELSEQARREDAVARLQPNASIDLSRSDIQFQDGQATLTQEARKEQATARLSNELGIDLSTDQIKQAPDGQGFVASKQAQKQAAAQELAGELQIDPDTSDITLTEQGAQLTAQAEKREAAAQLQDETVTEIDAGDVVRTDDGFELSDQARKRDAAERLSDELNKDVRPSDVTLEEGAGRLSQEVRERVLSEAEQAQEPVTVDATGETVQGPSEVQGAPEPTEFFGDTVSGGDVEEFIQQGGTLRNVGEPDQNPLGSTTLSVASQLADTFNVPDPRRPGNEVDIVGGQLIVNGEPASVPRGEPFGDSVSGGEARRFVERGGTFREVDRNLAFAAQLENQFDIPDPREPGTRVDIIDGQILVDEKLENDDVALTEEFFSDDPRPGEVRRFLARGGSLENLESRPEVSSTLSQEFGVTNPAQNELLTGEIQDGEVQIGIDKQAAAERVSEQTGADIDQDEITVNEETGEIQLSDFAQEKVALERAAQEASEATGEDIGIDEVQVDTQSGEVQLKEDVQKELVAQDIEGVSASDIKRIERGTELDDPVPTDSTRIVLTEDAQRERAAQQASQDLGVNVQPEDIELTEDGYEVSGEPRTQVIEQRAEQQLANLRVTEQGIRNAALRDAARQAELQDTNVKAIQTGSGVQLQRPQVPGTTVDPVAQADANFQATQAIGEQLEGQLGRQRIRAADPTIGALVSEEQAAEAVDLESGEDFTLQRTATGIQARLTDDRLRKEAAANADTQTQADVETEDVEIQELSEQEADLTETALETVGFDGDIEPTRRGAVDISEDDATEEQEPETETVRVRGEEREAFANREDAVDAVVEANLQLGDAFRENVRDPSAEIAGDVNRELLQVATGQTQREILRGRPDINIDAEKEEDPGTVEGITTTASKGVGETGAMVVEAPAGIIGVGRLGAGAVQTTGENIQEEGVKEGAVESAEAGAEFSANAIAQAWQQARERPIYTGGVLAGTALTMGGAAAASSRAGLATRAAIQPGEELLGYGGNFVLRQLPGRASRSAEVLFPNNEPLLISEEAGIAAVRGTASRARSGASRARQAVGGDSTLTLTPRQRELVEQVRPGRRQDTLSQAEIESEQETAETDELGTPQSERATQQATESDEQAGEAFDPAVAETDTSQRRGRLTLDVQPRAGAGLVPPRVELTRTETNTRQGTDPEISRDEILEGSPRDRLSQDISQRTRRDVRQVEAESESGRDRRLEGRSREAESRQEQAQQPEVTAEQEVETGPELSPRVQPPDAETQTGTSELFDSFISQGQETRLGVGARTGVETRAGVRPEQGVENRVGLETDQEVAQEIDAELEQELENELESELENEFEQEAETETESEFEQEVEREVETETETETETESEVESEFFPRDGLLPGAETSAEGGEDEKEIITDFVNPLTGEVDETTPDPRDESIIPGTDLFGDSEN